MEDVSAELFDDCYAHKIPETLRYYIDYGMFARDQEISGELVEFKYNGTTYTCINANFI